MNIVGVFLWVAVGATALHYWHGYLFEHKYQMVDSEREVRSWSKSFIFYYCTFQ